MTLFRKKYPFLFEVVFFPDDFFCIFRFCKGRRV